MAFHTCGWCPHRHADSTQHSGIAALVGCQRKMAEAYAIVSSLENYAVGQGFTLAEPQSTQVVAVQSARYRDLFRPPHLRRVLMLLIATPASSIAFYGFAHWVPTLLEHQGVTVTKSLLYAAMIGVAYPLSPLLASLFSDRIERKWQIAGTGMLVAVLGLLSPNSRRRSCGLRSESSSRSAPK